MTTTTRPVVRSQVEPRLVERRRTVHVEQRRRRRRAWTVLAVVVVLLALVVGAAWSPLADVDSVTVTGTGRLDPDELRGVSGIELGDQLVMVDLAAARARLRRLPLVASASVRRDWPDTVRISVVEEAPLLRVRSGEAATTVSSTGRVLPADLEGVGGLAELEVPPDSPVGSVGGGGEVPAPVRSALVVFARIPPSLKDRLASARLDEDGALTFALADGATIEFGPVEGIPAKLMAVEAFLDQVTLACLDVLDVRDPGRITASRRPGCAVPPPTDLPR